MSYFVLPPRNAQLPIIFPLWYCLFSGKCNIFYFLHPSPDVFIPGVVYRETIINKTLLPFLLHVLSLEVKVGNGMANGINNDFERINWAWSSWPIALFSLRVGWTLWLWKLSLELSIIKPFITQKKTKTTYSQY